MWVFGIVSLGVYGVLIGGWASNNKYSLIGAIRAASQNISYELAMGLSIIAILMFTGSLSTKAIVETQQNGHWNILYQPVGFIIFLVCAFAECNRTPFDLPECETELIGGYHTEYSSMKLGFYLFSEYINMFISGAVMATLYFGGYDYPGFSWVVAHWGGNVANLLGIAAIFTKALLFVFFFMWVRWTIPRFRYDQLMSLGWTGLIPLAMPEGVPRYLVCNADESEPGTFKDHYLMWKSPHTLIEGMIVSSYALGANTSYIYVRGELMYVIHILEKAIQEAYDKGYLGKNIMGSGYDLDLFVQPGGGAYICGEETALLESLEGKRGNPRNKPPFPAVKGVWQCPTVVNNVESIAAVSWIVNNGGDEYAKIGIGKSTGTKLISASGQLNKPGVYEIPMGITVEDFIFADEWCGGMKPGYKLKACIAGGSSVPILPAELLLTTAAGEKRLMTYESLSDGGFATGTMMGSGGFIVMDQTTCIVQNTMTLAKFYHHESCGQCSPCREGT
ncbi:hypothetical protein B566_EDAN018764, partial [Ephemera danica]